jgi:hypothetical protein
VTTAALFTVPPYGVLMLGGALAGAVQGGIGAALAGGDSGDVIFAAGLGGMLGCIVPQLTITSLVGSLIGLAGTRLFTSDQDRLSLAWDLGGLLGGVSSRWALAGTVTGGVAGYLVGGDGRSAFYGGIAGGLAGEIVRGRLRGTWAVRRGTAPTSTTARFRGEPFAFGQGARSQRVQSIVDEAARASGINDVSRLVDDVIYNPAGSYFTVQNGRRILSLGDSAFGRTRTGQLLEAAHEIVHAQQFQRFAARRFAGQSIDDAADAFFSVSDRIYARQERVAEHLARLRISRHVGGLTPQQWGASTRYINEYRVY